MADRAQVMHLLRAEHVANRAVNAPGFMIGRPQVVRGAIWILHRCPGQLLDFPDVAVAKAPESSTAFR